MLWQLDKKLYSDQPPPNKETLIKALDEAIEFCFSMNLNIKDCNNLNKYRNISKFIAHCFEHTGRKLLAVKKLGMTFRNESLSLHRAIIEIVVDASWIWHYYEFETNPNVAEKICEQFFLNAPAKFISEYQLIKRLFPQDPFTKKYYNEENLKTQFKGSEKRVGIYKYQVDWRNLKSFFNQKKQEWRWKIRCLKTGAVMQKYTKHENPDFYRNLSVLSSYTHWDSLQLEYTNDEIDEAIYNKNLNALIGIVHDLIQLGYHILDIQIPISVRASRQRIIW